LLRTRPRLSPADGGRRGRQGKRPPEVIPKRGKNVEKWDGFRIYMWDKYGKIKFLNDGNLGSKFQIKHLDRKCGKPNGQPPDRG